MHANQEIDMLLKELKAHQWETNWQVADALSQIGVPAVPRLIDALSDPDGYVRAAAAEALGKIRDARSVDALSTAMCYHDEQIYKDDEDTEARLNAALALGKIGDVKALEPLIAVVLGQDPLLASYAIDALGMLGDSRAIPTLISALKVHDVDIPRAASRALTRIGTAAVTSLVESLKSSEGRWRIYALKSLGAIGDPGAEDCIEALLNDPDESVRINAATALSQLKRI